MEEGEYGRFDYSGIHVDINKNVTKNDVAASSLHEDTHRLLASATSVGMLDFLLMNIYEVERNEKIRGKIKQLYDRISNSSLKVQESTAVLVELLMLNSIDEKDYLRTLNMYVDGRVYMREYGFEKLKFLLQIVPYSIQDREKKLLNIANNIRKIAIKSMNVDFYKENPLDGKYMKYLDSYLDKYNANYRFMKIVRYIENKKEVMLEEMEEEEIDNIFRINGLSVDCVFNWDKFREWANNMLCRPLGIKAAEEYINFVKDIEIEEQICSIAAYNSFYPFKKRILNTEKEIIDTWTNNDILYIHYEETYFMHVLINIEKMIQSLFLNKYALTNLANEVKMLFMDRNHYKMNISKCPQLVEYDTFVDMGNVDSYFVEFIRDEAVVDYYIKSLNKHFCLICFRGSCNTVFFLLFPTANVTLLIKTYFEELILQDKWWDDFISMDKLEYFCKFLTINKW